MRLDQNVMRPRRRMPGSGRSPSRVIMASGLLAALAFPGQAPRGLPPASARLSAEFTRIVGVRELSDGRVLIADGGDTRLVVADLAHNTTAPIGRQGGGPGEYTSLGPLLVLGGDSSLMADRSARRWLLLDRDRIVSTLPPDAPALVATNGSLIGADRYGFVLGTRSSPPPTGSSVIGRKDSVAGVRVALASGTADTVLRLRRPPARMNIQTDPKGRLTSVSINRPPFSIGEEAFVFPDGWLAVARLDPYRLDWRSPDGRWIHGPPLPFAEVKLDARERQAYIDRRTRESGKPLSLAPDEEWPATIPPFQASPLVGLPDGNVLVARTPTADHPESWYDWVDRRGRLIAQLRLPANQRLAAVGQRGAYVVTTDDDGIQRLERHPWP